MLEKTPNENNTSRDSQYTALSQLVVSKLTGRSSPSNSIPALKQSKCYRREGVKYKSKTHIVYAALLERYFRGKFSAKDHYQVNIEKSKSLKVDFTLLPSFSDIGDRSKLYVDIRHGYAQQNWHEPDKHGRLTRKQQKSDHIYYLDTNSEYVVVGSPGEFYDQVLTKILRPSVRPSREDFIHHFLEVSRSELGKLGLISNPSPTRKKYNKRSGIQGSPKTPYRNRKNHKKTLSDKKPHF